MPGVGTRKLPWKSIVAIVLLFVFIIFPIYNTFRDVDRHLKVTRRVDRAFEVVRKWNTDKYLDASVFAFLKRVSIVTSVAGSALRKMSIVSPARALVREQ